MSEIAVLSNYSELVFAAYANLRIGDNTETDFRTIGPDMVPALATSLAARYQVIDILNDPLTGAYAVVFEDKVTGARTLAIRGTSDVLDVLNDAYLLVGIPASLNLQYLSLVSKVNEWQSAGVVNSATTLTGHCAVMASGTTQNVSGSTHVDVIGTIKSIASLAYTDGVVVRFDTQKQPSGYLKPIHSDCFSGTAGGLAQAVNNTNWRAAA